MLCTLLYCCTLLDFWTYVLCMFLLFCTLHFSTLLYKCSFLQVHYVIAQVYVLLNENYVEDDDNMFRFDYRSQGSPSLYPSL